MSPSISVSCLWYLITCAVPLIYLFIYLFLFLFIFGCVGLRCCTQAFSSCSEQGLLFIVVRGLLIVVACLVAEHGL